MNPQSIANLSIVLILIGIFLFAALPFKNFLEIHITKKENDKWGVWLSRMPSKEAYCKTHQSSTHTTICDFCKCDRQLKTIEKVLNAPPKFGVVNNLTQGKYQFNSYFCSKCGTELYREQVIIQ